MGPQFSASSPSMPTVLCIEAQPAVAEHARHFLEQVTPRLRFVTAPSGREGLALARAHTPEVVLLDLALPDGDGLELIEPLLVNDDLFPGWFLNVVLQGEVEG